MALKTTRETTPLSDANKNASIWPAGSRDRTVGTYFVITAYGSVIWGIRCYWPNATPVTVIGHLYKPAEDAPFVTKEFAMNGVGWYDLEFDDPKLTVDGADYAMQNISAVVQTGYYCVTLYETTGVYVPRGNAVSHPLALPTFQACFIGYRDSYISNVGSGDIKPKTLSDRCFVDPIIYGNLDLFDPDPPFLDNRQPAPNSHGVINPSNGHIEMDIVDLDTGVEKSTILVKISNSDGVLTTAYNGSINPPDGTFYNPFNGPLSSIGEIIPGSEDYRIVFDRIADFPSYQNVEVNVYAKDEAENILNETYYFHIEDYEPPVYYSPSLHPPRQNPEITGQSENTWIRAGIYDKGSGIDASSVHMYIDGIDAYNGLSGFVPGYDTHSTFKTHIYDGYDGYEITIYKNTRYKSGDTISVEVYATDNEGN